MSDEQKKTIRFIDSKYNTLFYLKNGENIVVNRWDGEKVIKPCTFLDETHVSVGGTVFHICEFAEKMEKAGNTYAPEKPPELPDKCYAMLPDTGEVVLITKGKKGYEKCGFSTDNRDLNRLEVDRFNAVHHISRQQEAAMVGGATKGWSSPAAKTYNYDVYGERVKLLTKAKMRKPKEMER